MKSIKILLETVKPEIYPLILQVVRNVTIFRFK